MNHEQRTAIGAFIRQRREQLDVSQTELAETLGRTQTFVSYLEAGRRRPSVDTLAQIATALKVEFRVGPEGISYKTKGGSK